MTWDGDHGGVELVAELEAAEYPHILPPQNKRRKKTPSQLFGKNKGEENVQMPQQIVRIKRMWK